MLRSLEIRDMLIIDRLVFEPGAGLNVLTGETGAGKSILLDSLGFVLGRRGRSDMVRAGYDVGEVVAVFDLPPGHAAFAILEEAGITTDNELILRRISRADGRKSAWVNDRRASGEVLRALSETLVEIHGQQDASGLLNPRLHSVILDEFGGFSVKIASCRTAWRQRASAIRLLKEARTDLAEAQAEEEYLRHALAEIEALSPEPGEDAALDARRRLMQGAEKVTENIGKAAQALGTADGAEARAGDALRWLEDSEAQAGDLLKAPLAALQRSLVELGEASDGVEAALNALKFNPLELEEAEERLFAIRSLARKHEVAPDDLNGFGEGLRARLAALDQGEADIATLEQAETAAQKAYATAAETLSAARKSAARRLDTAMMAELAPLKMERAVFSTQVELSTPGPEGQDAVSFNVATNPGAPAGPLQKIASGGELSRFLLALKVCLTGGRHGLTMIFDEIDRGIGGATADAVGRRLADLAIGGQVLVVTHSPQVAALGAHHWQVVKQVKNGVTLSQVVVLDAEAREGEVARMLAGDIVTEAARAAAKALLAAGIAHAS